MILDGYGLNDNCKANAVCEANTPVMDSLKAEYPFVKGNASRHGCQDCRRTDGKF